MSELNGKKILIIGDGNPYVDKLESALVGHKLMIDKLPCAEATLKNIESVRADLIFINYLNKDKTCKDVLTYLKQSQGEKVAPSFVLVNENNDEIQEVISLGATDYLTEHDDADLVIDKIRTLFTGNDNFSDSSIIDITPEKATVSATGIRVFVVEDDPLLRNLLSIHFNKASFPCEFSNDGRQVLPVIKQFKPNAIVLDLMLPGISGFEVLEEIKGDDSLKDIPVIVFSNRDGQDDRARAKELGAVAFYVKAMTDLSELVEKIELLAK